MKTKEVDKLINYHFKCPYKSGWYGFRVTCDLHSYGFSNMSPMSKQEYCSRVPKKTVITKSILGGNLIHKKGEKRPDYDPLCCSWKVCPKLKEMFKSK